MCNLMAWFYETSLKILTSTTGSDHTNVTVNITGLPSYGELSIRLEADHNGRVLPFESPINFTHLGEYKSCKYAICQFHFSY